MFGDNFSDLYEKDPFEALKTVVATFFEAYNFNASIIDIIECAEVATLIIQNNNFNVISQSSFQYNSGNTDRATAFNLFSSLNKDIERETIYLKKLEIKNRYLFISKKFSYVFTDNQISIIQMKINELREFLYKSSDLSSEHKARLLNKLERLQAELHKKMSNLDKFYGLMVESAVVLGKMGTAAQPFIDGVEKIVRIAFSVHALSEGLQNLPKLTFSTKDELDEC